MLTLKKIGTFLLGGFRTGARTVGLSPKAVAPLIGGAVTGLLALVGLTPVSIAAWVTARSGVIVSPEAVAAIVTLLAGKIAAVLLPPGNVIAKRPAPAVSTDHPNAMSTGTTSNVRVEFSTGGIGSRMTTTPPGSDAMLSSVARDRLGLD